MYSCTLSVNTLSTIYVSRPLSWVMFSVPASVSNSQAAEAAVMGLSVSPGELKTETVEEFISISDGQVRTPGVQHVPHALYCTVLYCTLVVLYRTVLCCTALPPTLHCTVLHDRFV
jgi:hypothetical protein